VAKTLLTLNRHSGKSKEERAAAMTLLELSSEPVANQDSLMMKAFRNSNQKSELISLLNRSGS